VADKDQFFSFEEALKELRLKEEELKRLVSEGEIRAFREGETMKLRRADVETLRNELSGGEVVDLGDVKEEFTFEDDTHSDAGMATQEIGMATEELSDVETIVDEGVEDVGVIDDDVETFTPRRNRDDEDEQVAAPQIQRRIAIVEEVPEEYEGAGTRTLLLVTTLVLILAIPLCIAISSGVFSAVAQTLAHIF
jgi:excisionase family DNA binding protein